MSVAAPLKAKAAAKEASQGAHAVASTAAAAATAASAAAAAAGGGDDAGSAIKHHSFPNEPGVMGFVHSTVWSHCFLLRRIKN